MRLPVCFLHAVPWDGQEIDIQPFQTHDHLVIIIQPIVREGFKNAENVAVICPYLVGLTPDFKCRW